MMSEKQRKEYIETIKMAILTDELILKETNDPIIRNSLIDDMKQLSNILKTEIDILTNDRTIKETYDPTVRSDLISNVKIFNEITEYKMKENKKGEKNMDVVGLVIGIAVSQTIQCLIGKVIKKAMR